jgi:hypothetical protein
MTTEKHAGTSRETRNRLSSPRSPHSGSSVATPIFITFYEAFSIGTLPFHMISVITLEDSNTGPRIQEAIPSCS